MVKHLPTIRETRVWSLDQEDPLEKEMATHSSTLSWKIPWTEEPGRLQSMGSKRVGHDWETSLFTFTMLTTVSIYEHRLCFHLFRSSLISFSTVFYFSEYKSYTPLDRFIPKYFTLFWCYYRWHCFINFILDYLNAIIQLNFVCYSCKLQPCLLNLLIIQFPNICLRIFYIQDHVFCE